MLRCINLAGIVSWYERGYSKDLTENNCTNYAHKLKKTAVTADFSSKQLLLFTFTVQNSIVSFVYETKSV